MPGARPAGAIALLPDLPPAVLALADGSTFLGHSIGAAGRTTGEVVFNTALTGYQEILTDPSYARQIVTLTYPHIGNTGVNDEDVESARVHAAGLVVRDLPRRHSNFRAAGGLSAYLAREGTVAIAGIDTRRLTRVLRSDGAQNGCVQTFEPGTVVGPDELAAAVAAAREAPSMLGLDLARVVSTDRRERAPVERFTREIAPLVLTGPPSVTGFAGGRPKATDIVSYWPALIAKEKVTTRVSVEEVK